MFDALKFYRTFNVLDLRERMHRADWSIGNRIGDPTSLTLHYDGAAPVARGLQLEIAHMYSDSLWHTRPGAFGVASGGDGVMYHLAIFSEGSVGQLRNLAARLWHCANTNANSMSIAIQMPLGINQAPTPIQWQRFGEVADFLIEQYGWPAGRQAARGHRDWPRSDGKGQSTCPGDLIYNKLVAWRGERVLVDTDMHYRVKLNAGIDFAAIRTGASTKSIQALNGTAHAMPGEEVIVDHLVVDDNNPNGAKVWAHLSPRDIRRDLGFIHLSLLERLS